MGYRGGSNGEARVVGGPDRSFVEYIVNKCCQNFLILFEALTVSDN